MAKVENAERRPGEQYIVMENVYRGSHRRMNCGDDAEKTSNCKGNGEIKVIDLEIECRNDYFCGLLETT